MVNILIYSPSPLRARALWEAVEAEASPTSDWEEIKEAIHRSSPDLLLLEASHTPEADKIPAYLADLAVTAPQLAILLLTEHSLEGAPSCSPLPSRLITLATPIRLAELRSGISQAIHSISQEKIALGAHGWFNPLRREIGKHSQEHPPENLTEKESEILDFLLHSGMESPCSKTALLETLWGYAENVDTRTLETHIYRLRGKLEALFGEKVIISGGAGGYWLEIASSADY